MPHLTPDKKKYLSGTVVSVQFEIECLGCRGLCKKKVTEMVIKERLVGFNTVHSVLICGLLDNSFSSQTGVNRNIERNVERILKRTFVALSR